MQPIIVPTINSNDTDVRLLSWSRADGERVSAGETIALLETTKATFDLAAECDGVLQTDAAALVRCDFGSTIGWIFADAAERELHQRTPAAPVTHALGSIVVTKAAAEFAAKHHITDEQLRALGKKIIKAKDVEALLPPEAAGEVLMLSAQQQTIARVVSRSRATIPDSFLVKKIAVDAALDAVANFSREQKALAGLPDLLVWIVSRLVAEFPWFFGALGNDLRFRPSSAGNIGVTFDVGQGLFIPVVKSAASLTLREIAKIMMGFRLKATRASFHAVELAGGDLSLSINMDTDIVLVQPIILPPQTCMLSLGAVQTEYTPDARRCIQLGAAFDHRAINGYQANAFLNAIKTRIEQPQPDGWH